MLSAISPQVLSLVVGVVAVGFGVLSLGRLRLAVSPSMERWASPVLGALAGLVNGSTSIPGPRFAIYLGSLKLDKRAFVYGITLIFAVGNVTQLTSYTQLGLYGGGNVAYALLLVPAALAGQQVGFAIQDGLEPDRFRRLVVVFVAVSGANLLARGFGLLYALRAEFSRRLSKWATSARKPIVLPPACLAVHSAALRARCYSDGWRAGDMLDVRPRLELAKLLAGMRLSASR